MSGNESHRSTRRTTLKLAAVVAGMFGFGFALVPMYSVICNITGLNGKTGTIDESRAETYQVDPNREITVQFVASLNENLGWEFAPEVRTMTVHPGKVYTANFTAKNNYDREMVGQAVPSVMPNVASRYFNKTECFCFTNQRFAAGQRRELPVSFIIDPAVPPDVHVVTLSYTFFDVTRTAALNETK